VNLSVFLARSSDSRQDTCLARFDLFVY